ATVRNLRGQSESRVRDPQTFVGAAQAQLHRARSVNDQTNIAVELDDRSTLYRLKIINVENSAKKQADRPGKRRPGPLPENLQAVRRHATRRELPASIRLRCGIAKHNVAVRQF